MQKHANTLQKTWDLEDSMEKMEITGQNVNIAVQLVSGIGTWKNGRKQCE